MANEFQEILGSDVGTIVRTKLDQWRTSILELHGATARPNYAVAGTMWRDTTSATTQPIYVYDGSSDILVGALDVAGGKFYPGASTSQGALSNLGITATASEINSSAQFVDDLTATASEINSSAQFVDDLTVTASQVNSAGQLSGRNLLINPQGRINQRGYVSGTPTTSVGQYTLDRWKVVVSGQSLTFTGGDTVKTMTAPAGGIEQVIEAANMINRNYVLNWQGDATATVNGIPISKGGVFTSSGIEAIVRFTGGVVLNPQFEAGEVATPFEHLDYGQELHLCQRYYAQVDTFGWGYTSSAGLRRVGVTYFPTTMRATPTVVGLDAFGSNVTGQNAASITNKNFGVTTNVIGPGEYAINVKWAVDAEL